MSTVNGRGKLLHEELTERIIGTGMHVQDEVGPGWNERAYHMAMVEELRARGMTAESKLRGRVLHRGVEVDRFELDILVEDCVVLELKHLRGDFPPVSYTQLISYLKFWDKDLGMLMNFAFERLRFDRVPYTSVQGSTDFVGPWREFSTYNARLASTVAEAAQTILGEHGLGYAEKTCRNLVRAELVHRGIPLDLPETSVRFHDTDLGIHRVDAVRLDSQVLVLTGVGRDGTTVADLARLRSYLRQMGLDWGVIMNFGRRRLTIRPVHSPP